MKCDLIDSTWDKIIIVNTCTIFYGMKQSLNTKVINSILKPWRTDSVWYWGSIVPLIIQGVSRIKLNILNGMYNEEKQNPANWYLDLSW